MGLFRQPDIARAARSMIKDFGRRAAEKAAEEGSNARLKNRSIAEATWKRIEQEICDLQADFEADT